MCVLKNNFQNKLQTMQRETDKTMPEDQEIRTKHTFANFILNSLAEKKKKPTKKNKAQHTQNIYNQRPN